MRKKNALIIFSAMEYTINRNFNILLQCLFPKILHPPTLRASYATAHDSKILFLDIIDRSKEKVFYDIDMIYDMIMI